MRDGTEGLHEKLFWCFVKNPGLMEGCEVAFQVSSGAILYSQKATSLVMTAELCWM